MHKVFFRPKALIDLEEIFDYTSAEWYYKQAIIYLKVIDGCIEKIAKNNEIGRVYPYAKLNYKYYKCGRHLIFYRIDDETCFVVRILHEKMDIESIL